MKVVWTPLALERVAEIAALIAEERPQTAAAWVEGIFTVVERLGEFPESGRVVPEVQRAEIREVVHASYRIIYRHGPGMVAILTLRHTRQLTGSEDIPV